VDSFLFSQPVAIPFKKRVVLSSILFAMPDPTLGFWVGTGFTVFTITA
jgi:hypothetical protein